MTDVIIYDVEGEAHFTKMGKNIPYIQAPEFDPYPVFNFLVKFISIEGHSFYIINDSYHNPFGPAVVYGDGYKEWFIYNKRRRLDGPAVEGPDDENNEWWINNKKLLNTIIFKLLQIL